MRTDGLFDTAIYDIGASKVKIIPVGDIHYGAEEHAESVFDDFCRYGRAEAKNPHTYFLLMGDQYDAMSATEQRTYRRELASEGLRSTSTQYKLDCMYKKTMAGLAKKLDFMRGKTLGVLGGNHSYTFEDGLTIDQLLAQRLEAPYLGVLSLIRLVMHRGTSSYAAHICAHHGKGGNGKTVGHQFNTVDEMAQIFRADIYCMGHNHGLGVVPGKDELVPYINQGKLDVKAHKRWLCRTGSFSKGYIPKKKSHVVDSLLRPNSLGWVDFVISLRRDHTDGKDTLALAVRGTTYA